MESLNALSVVIKTKEQLETQLETLKKQVFMLANDLENKKIDGGEYSRALQQNSEDQDTVQDLINFTRQVLASLRDVLGKVLQQFESSLINQVEEVNKQIEEWTERKEWLDDAAFKERAQELGTRQQFILKKIQIIQGVLSALA